MGRKPKKSPFQLDGLLVLRKPSGPTSADCLNKIKHGLKQYKIGHAGTLDPLAEGVLLALLGQGTKLAPYLSGAEKVYSGTFRLGQSTDTYDIEGTVTEEKNTHGIDPKMVENAILAWNDLTEQEVPAYSAAKHKGKPLYELARKGEEVPVKVKPVTISQAEVVDIALPEASFRVRCSAGTYIRSLVHSLGTRLGCGAVLTRLLREESHPFGLDRAHGLDEVLGDPEHFAERIIPLAEMLPHWSRVTLTPPLAGLVRNGARLPVSDTPGQLLHGAPGDQAMFLDADGTPLALVEAVPDNGRTAWAILRGLW